MTRRLLRALVLALVTPAVMAGCGGDTPSASVIESTSPTQPTSEAGPGVVESADRIDDGSLGEFREIDTTGRVTGDAPASIVDELVQQVATENGLDVSAISVDVAIAKVWTDGSLGCAEPGFVYTQQSEAGYQIELSAEGLVWIYRVRESGAIVTCDE